MFRKYAAIRILKNGEKLFSCVCVVFLSFSLETLILNGCGIDKIEFSDVKFHETTKHFQTLKSLSLFHNKISEVPRSTWKPNKPI